MIEIKEAVQIAMKTIKDYYTDQKIYSLLLEEVEQSSDGNFWLITIGFHIKNINQFVQKYKILKINKKTSQTISMKIREA